MTPTATSPGMAQPATPAWLDTDLYPFAHHERQLAAGRVHYIDEGTGEPVLFVHGTPSWSFEFRHLVRGLCDRFRCIAPDHLGFGLSERPVGFSYSPEAHAAVLQEFVASLGLQRITLVVHDFGGPIAIPLALAGRVRRLVVLNSWMWPIEDERTRRQARMIGGPVGRWLYAYANFSLRVLMPYAYGRRGALSRRVHRQYLAPFTQPADRARVLHALARSLVQSDRYFGELWQARRRLAEIRSLVVWGTRDPVLDPSHLARWPDVLPAARIREIPAGHWPHEEEPELVFAAVQEFLCGP